MFKFQQRLHGFRFSWLDGLILVAAAVGTWMLWQRGLELWWLLPMVVGHFFLFCNVFRVRRNYELTWALLFLLNSGFWMSRLSLDGLPPLLCQLPVTLAVVCAELCSPRYHGIFAEKLNPALPAYVASRNGH